MRTMKSNHTSYPVSSSFTPYTALLIMALLLSVPSFLSAEAKESGPDSKPSKGTPPVTEFSFKQPEKAGKNLIVNGDLQKPRKSQVKGETNPFGWLQNSPKGDHDFDGVTAFYKQISRDKKQNYVIECHTGILEKHALARDAEMMNKTTKPAPIVEPAPDKKKYATIGAAYGVRVWTAKGIKIKKGAWYLMACDIKGPACPKIFIKGYGVGDYKELNEKLKWEKSTNMAGPVAVLYSTYLQTKSGVSKKKWTRVSKLFNPSRRSPRVDEIKLQIFAYWPRGVYSFDNFEIRLATKKEVADHLAEQEKVREGIRKRKIEDRKKEDNGPRKRVPLEEVQENL